MELKSKLWYYNLNAEFSLPSVFTGTAIFLLTFPSPEAVNSFSHRWGSAWHLMVPHAKLWNTFSQAASGFLAGIFSGFFGELFLSSC